jgi:hypothetical protein
MRRGRLAAPLRFAACIFFAGLAFDAGAETLDSAFIAEHGALIVSRVVYSGNMRTRASAIAELTGIASGEKLADIDPDAVAQSLLKSGIFSEASLSVDIEDESAVVTVAVKEKWTFIPVPSGYYGSGGWSAGLDLVEFNFLGLRKTLVIGGSDSNLGLSGTLAYIDPRFLRTKTTFKVFASYANSTEEAQYMDGSEYAAFTKTTANAGLYLEYPSESKLRADVELTLRYSGVSAADVADNTAGLLQSDALVLIPGVGLNYDGQRFSGYHESGPTAYASYTPGFGLRGLGAYYALTLSAEEKLDAFLDGLLDLGFEGRYGSTPFQALGSLSGSGYRTLPQGTTFSSKSVAAYASFELPFVEARWCVMTLGAFYEGGAYETGPAGDTGELFHGPGLSYRLYLHDIALPAVGVDFAYNIPAAALVFSVNVGLSL